MAHQAQNIIEANNRQASNGHSHGGRTVELQMAKAMEDEQMSFKRPKPSRPTTEELQRATATEDEQRSFKRPKPSRPTTEELQTVIATEDEQSSFKRPKLSRPTTEELQRGSGIHESSKD